MACNCIEPVRAPGLAFLGGSSRKVQRFRAARSRPPHAGRPRARRCHPQQAGALAPEPHPRRRHQGAPSRARDRSMRRRRLYRHQAQPRVAGLGHAWPRRSSWQGTHGIGRLHPPRSQRRKAAESGAEEVDRTFHATTAAALIQVTRPEGWPLGRRPVRQSELGRRPGGSSSSLGPRMGGRGTAPGGDVLSSDPRDDAFEPCQRSPRAASLTFHLVSVPHRGQDID